MASSITFDEEECYVSIIESFRNPQRENENLWLAKTVLKIQKAYEIHLNPQIANNALILVLSLVRETLYDPITPDARTLSESPSKQYESLKELLKGELLAWSE